MVTVKYDNMCEPLYLLVFEDGTHYGLERCDSALLPDGLLAFTSGDIAYSTKGQCSFVRAVDYVEAHALAKSMGVALYITGPHESLCKFGKVFVQHKNMLLYKCDMG